MSTSSPGRKPGARDRLVATAERLFYAEGIRAVGVERLCNEAGVSKRSLYQHFTGKDDVVTAVLRSQAAAVAAELGHADLPPRDRILATFRALDAAAVTPEAMGCPFISAAAELKDRDHPAVKVACEQKLLLTEYFATALSEAGVAEPAMLADGLRLLFDGASSYAQLHGKATAATEYAVTTLLAAHGL